MNGIEAFGLLWRLPQCVPETGKCLVLDHDLFILHSLLAEEHALELGAVDSQDQLVAAQSLALDDEANIAQFRIIKHLPVSLNRNIRSSFCILVLHSRSRSDKWIFKFEIFKAINRPIAIT